MQIDIPVLEDFAYGDQGIAQITAEVVKQAKEQWFLAIISSVQQNYRFCKNIMYSISILLCLTYRLQHQPVGYNNSLRHIMDVIIFKRL